MKTKVSEASGPVLDWMVKTAEGFSFDGKIWSNGRGYYYLHSDSPSTNWSQGGRIIEREGINLFQRKGLAAKAGNPWLAYNEKQLEAAGPTPLIAAMRCYVSSKLGEEVDVPEELI